MTSTGIAELSIRQTEIIDESLDDDDENNFTHILVISIFQAVSVLQIVDSKSNIIQELNRILTTHQTFINQFFDCLRDSLFIARPENVLRDVVSRVFSI